MNYWKITYLSQNLNYSKLLSIISRVNFVSTDFTCRTNILFHCNISKKYKILQKSFKIYINLKFKKKIRGSSSLK